MTFTKPIVRRLLSSGALCAALGALTVATAAPANASPLVWGNAQAWVSDGDLVSGYSTAISHGGDPEDEADGDGVRGPLSDHAELRGLSHTVVDDDGAHATSTVESAEFGLGVEELIGLGMLDVPDTDTDTDDGDGDGGDEGEEPSAPEDQAAPEQNGEDGEPEGGAGTDRPGRSPAPEEPPGRGEDGDGDAPDRGSPAPEESPEPEATETPHRGEARLAPATRTGAAEAEGTDTVEFTVADVRTSVTAGFDGQTRTDFEHGEITAFGEPVGELERGERGTVVQNTLEVPGTDGDPAEEVPVSVRFFVNETAFEDEDPDWEGAGARSWLTVWVQVGDPEDDNGFAVDLADSWALGSTYASGPGSTPEAKGGGAAGGEERPVGRLPTTGGSLAALVTAACVAVGGGAAATYLARGRTTALDDRIED